MFVVEWSILRIINIILNSLGGIVSKIWRCARCGSSFQEILRTELNCHPISICVKLLGERVEFLEQMLLSNQSPIR